MKAFVLNIVFAFVAFAAFSQSIKISINNYGVLLKNNEETHGHVIVYKDEDRGKYIIGIKRGYMPQAVSVDELFSKNISEFSFNLSPVTKPTLSKDLKKIRFSKFVDLNYNTGKKGLLSMDLQKGDPKFSVAMDTFLINKGFDVPQINTVVVSQDYKNSDVVLGAEVLYYKASKSGTPGFRCSAAFKWSVYDVAQEKVVFTFLTGGYSNEETKINESEAFIIAAQDAAQELINNKDFIHLTNIEK